MPYKFKLSLIAAAVGLAIAGQASANGPGAPTYIGAGASAVKSSIIRGIVGASFGSVSEAGICGSNAATYYDDATSDITSGTVLPSGNVFRIKCGSIDISYDANGGAWRALIVANPSMFSVTQNTALNSTPVNYVNTAGTNSKYTITSFSAGGVTFTFSHPIAYVYGNGDVIASATTDVVDYGLTDNENPVFLDPTNQPLTAASISNGSYGNLLFPSSAFITATSPNAEAAGYPKPGFGVVYGIAVSNALYLALQAAQGLNTAQCNGVQGYTSPACAPSISSADYRALAADLEPNSFSGPTAAATTSTPAVFQYFPIDVARREQGAGVQASSNAYFFNDGCAAATGQTQASDLTEALPTANDANMIFSYNQSTGAVLKELQGKNGGSYGGYYTPNHYVIGVVSTENDSASKLGAASFVKLDGIYPGSATASGQTAGIAYGFISTEYLHCSQTPGATTICNAISADTINLPTAAGLLNLATTGYSTYDSIIGSSVGCGGSRRTL